jgi:hypothetical protein
VKTFSANSLIDNERKPENPPIREDGLAVLHWNIGRIVVGSANSDRIKRSRQATYAQTSSLAAISWLLSPFAAASAIRALTASE